MNIPTWVEIVSTTLLGAEPDGVESKHTCNARLDVRKRIESSKL